METNTEKMIPVPLNASEILCLLSLIEETTNGEQTDEFMASLIEKLDQALPF